MKQTKKKECKGIVSCAVNCGGIMCQNTPRKTDKNKPREVIFEECISRYKTLEARVLILENKPCKIEINKSKKRKINPTKGIDENLKCSHCRNKVIECMGKCETTLFKAKELKEKKISFWSKFKNIINIKP